MHVVLLCRECCITLACVLFCNMCMSKHVVQSETFVLCVCVCLCAFLWRRERAQERDRDLCLTSHICERICDMLIHHIYVSDTRWPLTYMLIHHIYVIRSSRVCSVSRMPGVWIFCACVCICACACAYVHIYSFRKVERETYTHAWCNRYVFLCRMKHKEGR